MSETVADHVLTRLREWDVEQVFAYPGDGINGLAVLKGEPDAWHMFAQGVKTKMQELLPSRG